ncbi:MAG: TIM barrel protein [Planctomycetota bacterium]
MNIDRRDFLTAAAALSAAGATGSVGATSVPGQDGAVPLPWGKTRFAVNIEMWGLGGGPHHDRIRAAAKLGYPAVEMWPWRGKNLDEIVKACDETGVEVAQFTAWGFSPGMNDPKNHDRMEKEVAASLETAKKIKARKMTVIAGNDQPGMTQQQMHENVIVGLKRLAPLAEDAGVMLILEPMNIRVDHKGHCLYGSPDAVRICREVNSPMVKINWDLYHMQITEGDLCRRLREGWDQVGYLQLADNPGRREPGTGEIQYSRVFKEAWNLGYRDYVGLECSPSVDEAMATERVKAADVW